MTPAELKTLRESLGLTAQWVADQAGVRLRTVQYWEAGRAAVPEDVARLIEGVEAKIDAAVAQAVEIVEEHRAQHGELPPEVLLRRYRSEEYLWRHRPDFQPLPLSAHGALLARVRQALRARGIPVRITYEDEREYLEWLNGRQDTDAERAAWAALKQGHQDEEGASGQSNR
ncbi:helix-turn-helix domain-containing protein [Geopseudomonas aromaticivorans]